jgi:hypothetical protein
MRLNELPLKGYKKFIICGGCNKRFRQLHGLRKFCDHCKPPVMGAKLCKRK